MGRRNHCLYVIGPGVSTELPRWNPQPHLTEEESAERRAQWQEWLRQQHPNIIQDLEGAVPPMLIQPVNGRERMPRNFEKTHPAEKPRTPSELFKDLAEKVAPNSVKQFKTASASRSADGESITVEYVNTKRSKTVKQLQSAEYDDRTVQVYELAFPDASFIRETIVRFKEVAAPTQTNTNGDGREFDEDFEPLSVGMWRDVIRRYVRFFPDNQSFSVDNVSYLIETFRVPSTDAIQLNVALDFHQHIVEPFLSNLASKMRYIQMVKQMPFKRTVEEQLPILLAHVDHFNATE